MDPAVTSPAAAGHPPRAPSPAHNYSNDVNQMPDSPPRRRGHRRAQSEIALRLPDEAAFERELGVEMPAFSDDGTEDLFSMYIDMEQMNTNYGGAPSSNNALPPSTGHHSRSLSVDALSGFNKSGSFSTDVRRPRHQHSNSMDGSTSFDFEGSDGKKAMASAKLSEIALVDPKRAKRILANRQSAARSKERKMRYISELERKVQGLQTEATTLSAQLALLEKDTTGLSTENNELKLRLQSMEQQAQLRDALHEALRDEVQRLKLATGEISSNGSSQSVNLGGQRVFQMGNQSLNAQQIQQLQQAQTALNNQQQSSQQQMHSEYMQRGGYGGFIKPEGSSIAINHGSSASFG